MKELVSVIIPFYNEEQYIGDCLISLIKQTYKNIEIICVDDGSTDNGAMIVKAIQQSDSRISLIQQENMNAGTARNVGFSKAKGEYVLFLDSDDFFSPSMVIPPSALTSSTAIWIPVLTCVPASAELPVVGPDTPILIVSPDADEPVLSLPSVVWVVAVCRSSGVL